MELDIIKIGNSQGIPITCCNFTPVWDLRTIIIASMTKSDREGYHTRFKTMANQIEGWVILDPIRSIDKTRPRNKIGDLTA